METVLISGLVAGAISLIGLLANLHIARKGREANKSLNKLNIYIKEQEKAILLLRGYTKSTESFRIQCWVLVSRLSQLKRQRRGDWGSSIKEEHIDQFVNSYKEFFDAWADIKSDIPESIAHALRRLRHEVSNRSRFLIVLVEDLKDQVNKTKTKKELEELLNKIEEEAQNVLVEVDRIFVAVNNLRISKVDELSEHDVA